AIDRLRRRRLQVSPVSILETSAEGEGESNLLNETTESIWGTIPFATPEEVALQVASRQELRNLLKHCIKALSGAPRQFRAVLQNMKVRTPTGRFISLIWCGAASHYRMYGAVFNNWPQSICWTGMVAR